MRKLFPIGVIIFVLGAQIVLPVVGGAWYWPFLPYPMYSMPHYATESVPDHRVRARPCDPAGAEPVSLGAFDLGTTPYQLRDDLLHVARAAKATPPDTARLIEHTRILEALVKHAPGRWCEVEVWERAYPNTGDVASALRLPWHLAVRWPIGGSMSLAAWTTEGRIAPPVPTIPSLPPLSTMVGMGRRQ